MSSQTKQSFVIFHLVFDREAVLYAYYKDNEFILPHRFIKKVRKLTPGELEQAKPNLADYIE